MQLSNATCRQHHTSIELHSKPHISKWKYANKFQIVWKTISIYNYSNIPHQTRTMATGQYEAFPKHLFIHSSMCNVQYANMDECAQIFPSLDGRCCYFHHTHTHTKIHHALDQSAGFFWRKSGLFSRSVFLFFFNSINFLFPVGVLSIVWFFNCNGSKWMSVDRRLMPCYNWANCNYRLFRFSYQRRRKNRTRLRNSKEKKSIQLQLAFSTRQLCCIYAIVWWQFCDLNCYSFVLLIM